MKKFVIFIAFTFFIGLFAVNAVAQEPVSLTVPLPLSGPLSMFGQIQMRSYEIAMGEINAAGGIKGRKVVLEFIDSQGKPAISLSIVKRMIDVKKQPVIFGEYSSDCAKAVARLAEESKVPYMVVSAAADEITQHGYRYVFRMNPMTAYYASGLVSFLKNVVRPETVAILYEDSEYGTSGADAFSMEAGKAGIVVVVKQPYSKETAAVFGEEFVYLPDPKVDFATVKAAKPDVIYMVSYETDAAYLMKQIKRLKIDAKLFAGGAAGFAVPAFIGDAGEASEYVVTTTLWAPGIGYPGASAFAEKYRKLYREYPSYHGAEAYAALYIIKNVLERAKTWDPETIREAMKATNMMTAFGPIKFTDKEGFTNQNFLDTLAMQVINRKFEIIWPEKYATKKYIYPIPTWSQR